MSDPIAELFEAYRQYGRTAYLGEPLSITDHMLQTAQAAERDAATPALVAAAFLHDVAYLLRRPPDEAADPDLDGRHAEIGFAFLSRQFVPAVAEPVRLHVAAKRYLCAVDPGYRAALSPASIRTLEVQGGPFGPAEVRAFDAMPHAQEAVRLRRWDDQGKVAGAPTPDLEHFRPILEAHLLGRAS
jgi:phosphonate degradation associated HDIG domain protein